jgi:hypothetical protein
VKVKLVFDTKVEGTLVKTSWVAGPAVTVTLAVELTVDPAIAALKVTAPLVTAVKVLV